MKRDRRRDLRLILHPRGRAAAIVNRLGSRDRLALDRLGRLALLGLWVATAGIVARNLDQGWVPFDDGAFAQSAERVLAGELPHREFAELYTGGMTFLNAGVIALLGPDLIWLRLPLFILFLAFVPCVYFIARRFVRSVVAAIVALLAVSWSVPIYPAAVPSWYQLYFAVFGITALMRHLDTGRIRWLLIAGTFGGLSISFKIVGVWYVLAVLLYFVFVEQDEHTAGGQARKRGPSIYGALVVGFAGFSVAIVGALLAAHLGSAEVVNFLLPIALLCGIICTREWQVAGSAHSQQRLRAYAGLAVPFLVGVAVPVMAVVLPYVVAGSLGDLVRGVFVSPQSRLDYAYQSTPSALNLLWAAPLVVTLLGRRWVAPVWRRRTDVALVTLLFIAFVTAQHHVSYALLWRSARELVPVVVIAGCAVLFLASRRAGGQRDSRLLVLLLLVASFVSLLQFPFGAPVYFVYSAPLFALAGVAVVQQARGGGWAPVTLLAVYMLFGFTWLDRETIHTLGIGFQPTHETVILDRDIARIRVTPEHASTYRKAALLLERHATGGFVFAGPDAPELYYLSRHENPTRSLFDFLDTSNSARGDKLMRLLRERAVTAIAINLHPDLSDPLDSKTVDALQRLYPEHARAGKFDVRWK